MASQLFDTVIPLSLPATTSLELVDVALGGVTLVNCTLSGSDQATIIGLAALGGNIDGMVVVFSNISNNTSRVLFAHDAASATAGRRFRNSASAPAGGSTGAGCVWYRYAATLQRWIQLAKI